MSYSTQRFNATPENLKRHYRTTPHHHQTSSENLLHFIKKISTQTRPHDDHAAGLEYDVQRDTFLETQQYKSHFLS